MKPDPIDRVLLILLVCTFALVGILFAADVWLPNDQQIFSTVQTMASSFGGAALLRVKERYLPNSQTPAPNDEKEAPKA